MTPGDWLESHPMNEESKNQSTGERLHEAERRFVALGNAVESLFADSVVALLECSEQTAGQLREEDYKAHELWLQTDKLCLQTLSDGQIEPAQARMLVALIRMAADLKRTADESLRIGQTLRASQAHCILEADPTGCLPRMVELVQSMHGDVLEAFINRDAAQASALHLIFGELASLNEQVSRELPGHVAEERVPVELALALVGVGQRLERIADEVLDISNHVAHLSRESG